MQHAERKELQDELKRLEHSQRCVVIGTINAQTAEGKAVRKLYRKNERRIAKIVKALHGEIE